MKWQVSLLLLLLMAFAPFVHAQEVPAAIRYIGVEMLQNVQIPWGHPDDPEMINVTRVTFTFALFKVDVANDRCYYKAWTVTDEIPYLFSEWYLGFSLSDPPGMQAVGGYGDWLFCNVIMAEFPYTSEVRTHETDGTQLYYFYKIHFYANLTLAKGAYMRFAADYMQEPTYEGSELLVLKLQNEKDGVFNFKETKAK